MIAPLFGAGTASNGPKALVPAGSSLSQWRFVKRTLDRQMQALESAPDIRRATVAIRNELKTAGNADAFLKNHRLYETVMQAYGLGERVFAKGMMKRVLESDLKDPRSFANRLTDKRYTDIAKALGFGKGDIVRTGSPLLALDIENRFLTVKFEERLGNANTALRLAHYFERTAGQIDSMYDVLGDRAWAEVVRTGLGLPAEVARADIDSQARFLEKKLDIADFKDPARRADLINRFLVRYDLANGGNAGATNPRLALFQAPADGFTATGLNPATLLAAASFRRV